WLKEYGTLDGVIASAGKVGGKIGENLRAALAQLPLSRQLATIKTDVVLDHGPADLLLRKRDVEALRELYARYEFRQALKELDGAERGTGDEGRGTARAGPATVRSGEVEATLVPPQGTFQSPTPQPPAIPSVTRYELVTTREQLDAWL